MSDNSVFPFEALAEWRAQNPPRPVAAAERRLRQLAHRYNLVLLFGMEAIGRALQSSPVEPPPNAERYLRVLDKLADLHRQTHHLNKPPAPFYYFPIGPIPGRKMSCTNCGKPYNYKDLVWESPLKDRQDSMICCENPSIPGAEHWLGLWCIICLAPWFPSRKRYTRHPLRCPSCAKRYAAKLRQRRFRSDATL